MGKLTYTDINVWKTILSENNNISLQYFQLFTAPVNSSHSLILNHWVISVGGEHLKYTKTLKLCEMASDRGRYERLPARRDSSAMSTAKLRRNLCGKKCLEIPSSQGNLQSFLFLRN